MKMRRSHGLGFWAKLMALILLAGVVSPALVWCYDSNGRANVEFGQCAPSPCSKSASEPSLWRHSHEPACDSCIDSPIFTVEPNQGCSCLLVGLVVEMAGTSPLYLRTDSPDALPITAISHTSDEIHFSLPSIQSTVLLI